MSERVHVDPLDFEDLMRHVFEIQADDDVVEFLDIYVEDQSAADFAHELVRRLLPMIFVGQGQLSGNTYKAFASIDEDGHAFAFVKTPVGPSAV